MKQLEAGQDITWSTYTTEEPQWIGTTPIAMRMAGSGRCKIPCTDQGEFQPIVGRAGMDRFTVRLPEELPLGTKVTLIGREGEKEIGNRGCRLPWDH